MVIDLITTLMEGGRRRLGRVECVVASLHLADHFVDDADQNFEGASSNRDRVIRLEHKVEFANVHGCHRAKMLVHLFDGCARSGLLDVSQVERKDVIGDKARRRNNGAK